MSTLDEQILAWLQRRRRPAPPDLARRARERAEAALKRVKGTPEEELTARGIRIVEGPLGVPGLTVRARLDLFAKRLTLDPDAIAPMGPGGREAVLAHELFHALDEDCPKDMAEPAAHAFTTLLLNLDRFAGDL